MKFAIELAIIVAFNIVLTDNGLTLGTWQYWVLVSLFIAYAHMRTYK